MFLTLAAAHRRFTLEPMAVRSVHRHSPTRVIYFRFSSSDHHFSTGNQTINPICSRFFSFSIPYSYTFPIYIYIFFFTSTNSTILVNDGRVTTSALELSIYRRSNVKTFFKFLRGTIIIAAHCFHRPLKIVTVE